jgi:hypothetical protein
MDLRDSLCLYKIKNTYGGSVKFRSGSNSMRYRLHHKNGLLKLINDVNGHIRNSNRILQLIKITEKYGINFKYAAPLTFHNGWFSGFFDADGTITINKTNLQLSISVSQKKTDLLQPLVTIFNGNLYVDRSSQTFKLYVTKKQDVLNMIEYFKKYPCYSEKRNRLFLVHKFYDLIQQKNHPDFEKLKAHFFFKWDHYES